MSPSMLAATCEKELAELDTLEDSDMSNTTAVGLADPSEAKATDLSE